MTLLRSTPKAAALITEPLRHFETWNLSSLGGAARQRIKAGIASVHATVLDPSLIANRPTNDIDLMYGQIRVCYDVIAAEFLQAEVLDEVKLTETIPQMVFDVIVSGRWKRGFGFSAPTKTYTLEYGNYWTHPNVQNILVGRCLAGRIEHWRAKAMLSVNPTAQQQQNARRILTNGKRVRPSAIIETLRKDSKSVKACLRRSSAEVLSGKGAALLRRSKGWRQKLDARRRTWKVLPWSEKLRQAYFFAFRTIAIAPIHNSRINSRNSRSINGEWKATRIRSSPAASMS
jgi:hypothetical protein